MGFGPNTILVLDWNLNERQKYGYESLAQAPESPGNDETETRETCLDQVLVTRDKRVLVKMLYHESSSSPKTLLVHFQTASFTPTTGTESTPESTPALDFSVTPEAIAIGPIPTSQHVQ